MARGRIVTTKFEVANLGQVVADLRAAGASAEDLREVHADVAKVVADTSRRRAPRRSGAMASTTDVVANQRYGEVSVGGSTAPYVGPIHFGWETRGLGRRASRADLQTHLAGELAPATIAKASRQARTRTRAGVTRRAVRGGPIRPQPWLYDALDDRRAAVFERFERHVAAIEEQFGR